MSGEENKEKELTFVKLVSAEGSEFYIDRSVAISASKTIRTMLEGQFREAKDNVIHFPEISILAPNLSLIGNCKVSIRQILLRLSR